MDFVPHEGETDAHVQMEVYDHTLKSATQHHLMTAMKHIVQASRTDDTEVKERHEAIANLHQYWADVLSKSDFSIEVIDTHL